MTVDELYTLTKAIMFEKPDSDIYDDYLIGNVNLLLMELFQENNICRVFNDKDELASVPLVYSREDTLLYEDEYTQKVMPYGLAARFFIDEDLQKQALFATEYNNARVLSQKMVSCERLKKHAVPKSS